MQFKPLGNRIAIEPIEQTTRTPHGLYLPESAREKPLIGKVVATGKDAKNISINDIVLISKYAGTEFMIDEKPIVVVQEKQILAILADE